MTYLSAEKSKHSGKPNELYKFEGTYANFFYTSGPKAVRYPDNEDGDVYLPIAIRRSEINVGTQDDDGLDITVELAVTNELVQVYGFQDSPPSLNLEILRYHTLDEMVTYWNGPVNDIQVSNGVATVRSPSLFGAALDASIPNVFFQSPCNHVLYDARCKVNYADWSLECEVVSVAGRVITVDSVGTLDGKLLGGELKLASGERRMITAQNVGEIIVNFPFSQIHAADIATIAAGCDLAYKGDCKNKFDNNRNFGGFPFIPAANPFQDGIDASIVPLADNTCLPQIFDGVFMSVHFSAVPTPGGNGIVGNPCWDGDRYITIPNQQPNGGAVIGQIHFYGGTCPEVPTTYDFHEINDPATNPLWQGQLLARGTFTNYNNWKWEYFFPVEGAVTVHMFTSARYLGSVGSDGTDGYLTVGRFGQAPTTQGPVGVAGNSDTNFGPL